MKKYILVSSIGHGKHELCSFDDALLKSKIANYNLVKISSILPPNSVLSEEIDLQEGEILYTAYSSITTIIEDENIAAAVAVGIPYDHTHVGVIMEYAGHCDAKTAENTVRDMVKEAMELRGYRIDHIESSAVSAVGNGAEFKTALAALAIWTKHEGT